MLSFSCKIPLHPRHIAKHKKVKSIIFFTEPRPFKLAPRSNSFARNWYVIIFFCLRRMKISFVFRFWFCFCCTRQSDTRKNWPQLAPLIPGSNQKTCSSGDEILKVSSCFHKTGCQEKVSWWTKFKQIDENFKIHVGKKWPWPLLSLSGHYYKGGHLSVI